MKLLTTRITLACTLLLLMSQFAHGQVAKWLDSRHAIPVWIDTNKATPAQKAAVRAMLKAQEKFTKNKIFWGTSFDGDIFTGEWIDTIHPTPAQLAKLRKAKIMRNRAYGKNFVFTGSDWIDTTHASPAQMAIIHNVNQAKILTKDHYYNDSPVHTLGIRFTKGNLKSEIYEGLNWGDDKSFRSMLIQGDCGIDVAAVGITWENAKYYKFHIVQNYKTQLVDWTTPTVFRYTADHKAKYAYLGNYKYMPEQVLMIEIYDIRNYSRLDAIMISWEKIQPANIYSVFQYISTRYPIPDHGLLAQPFTALGKTKQERVKLINGKIVVKEVPFNDFIQTTSTDDIRFKLTDSVQNIDFQFSNRNRLYNYRMFLRREINGQVDSIDLGEENSRFVLYKAFWKSPGHYTMSFVPKIHKHGGEPIILLYNSATRISFTVLPPDYRPVVISRKKLAAIVGGSLLMILAIFTYFRLRQKRLLAKEAHNRQIATAQLQSVRAQLNPHFMFNALAGVQNLMNKNDTEAANKYLAKFARLTRNVLDDSNKELVSIEHEFDMLTDYLQMEQMRFGFKFDINIDEQAIDQQIEIPAMLLQPFAENAVKHGVSAMKEKGLININITSLGKTLLLVVQDNGKGFSDEQITGMGIKLCEERIQLLNSIYKNSKIVLHKKWDNNGTLISIELQNWL